MRFWPFTLHEIIRVVVDDKHAVTYSQRLILFAPATMRYMYPKNSEDTPDKSRLLAVIMDTF